MVIELGRLDVLLPDTDPAIAILSSGFYPFDNFSSVPIRMITVLAAAIETAVDYRNMGIGRTLMGIGMRAAKLLGMQSFEVQHVSSEAYGFYLRCGFIERLPESGFVWDIMNVALPLPSLGIASKRSNQEEAGGAWIDFGNDQAAFGPREQPTMQEMFNEHLRMLAPTNRFEKRCVAAFVLGELGLSEAIDPLIKALNDPVPISVERVIQALVKLGDRRSIQPISIKLEDHGLRTVAAWALGEIGEVEGIAPLLSHLGDVDLRFNDTVIQALEKLGVRDLRGRMAEAYTQALDTKDHNLQGLAASAIQYYKLTECVPALLAVVARNQTDPLQVLLVLARMGCAAAIEPLLDRLVQSGAWDCQSSEMECEAVENALLELGVERERIFDRYVCILTLSSESAVQCISIRRIALLGGPRALDAILAKLDATDDSMVKLVAIEMLGKQGDIRTAEEIFKRFGGDPQPPFYEAAIIALGRHRDRRALFPLLQALDILLSCEHIGDSRMSSRILEIVHSIAGLGDPQARPILEESKMREQAFLQSIPEWDYSDWSDPCISSDYTNLEKEITAIDQAIAACSS